MTCRIEKIRHHSASSPAGHPGGPCRAKQSSQKKIFGITQSNLRASATKQKERARATTTQKQKRKKSHEVSKQKRKKSHEVPKQKRKKSYEVKKQKREKQKTKSEKRKKPTGYSVCAPASTQRQTEKVRAVNAPRPPSLWLGRSLRRPWPLLPPSLLLGGSFVASPPRRRDGATR
jgi:hypothetical protein